MNEYERDLNMKLHNQESGLLVQINRVYIDLVSWGFGQLSPL